MNVELMKPFGFCAGVCHVVKMVKEIAHKHKDENVYCIGQVVHNKNVIKELTSFGVTMISGNKDEIVDSIDKGVVIFSAHGTNDAILSKAKEKGLIVYDLVCPFVKRELDLIKDKIKNGYDVIYIGIKGHDETVTALSLSDKIKFVNNEEDVLNLNINNLRIIAINQTTLSILELRNIYDAILKKYPHTEVVEEICSSTRLRQQAISNVNDDIDGIIIVGDKSSNNTLSLKSIAIKRGKEAILIEDISQLDYKWLDHKNHILVASGTSTPNEIVQEIYEKLKNEK